MATVSSTAFVYDWLTGQDDDQPLFLYRYTLRSSGAILYAAFWAARDDDIMWGQVADASCIHCLLWEGELSLEGHAWLDEYAVRNAPIPSEGGRE